MNKRSLNGYKLFFAALFTAALVFGGNAWAGSKDHFISFNTAPASEFLEIQVVEVPEALAKAIVSYREANGPYKTPEDLKKVPGMTDDLYEELDPIEEEGDIVFEKAGPGGMNAY